MTCVCTGISLQLGDRWFAADLHALPRAPMDVLIFRANTISTPIPEHSRTARVYADNAYATFDDHRDLMTVVVRRGDVVFNEEARAYVAGNAPHLL